jgi:outer membrane protein assembly factor BamB
MRYLVLLAAVGLACAEDWPEWRGAGRLGVWKETGIMEKFPEGGLTPVWRAPVKAGYSQPSVAKGRVYVTDYEAGVERAVCLEENTGKQRWEQKWEADYRGIDYGSGPRAAPTVDGDVVFVLGAAGHLKCLRTSDGAVVWQKHFGTDYGAVTPPWGFSSAPLVDGNRVIAVVAGKGNAKVVAFEKGTGKEMWRALPAEDSEPGYSQPILVKVGAKRQLVLWHAGAVSALDPATGRVLWEHPFKITMNTPIATPAYAEPNLVVSGFFNGARMLRLDARRDDAELMWKARVEGEIKGDTLHALMNAPVIEGDYVYGICAYGQLRCLRLATGERVWETQQVTVEKMRNVSAFMVKHGSRYVFLNDRGELIFGRVSPQGYEEISRTKVVTPTSKAGSRRELKAVNWTHPAFANKHILVRNDEEVLRYRLSAGK